MSDGLTLHMVLTSTAFREDFRQYIQQKAERAPSTVGGDTVWVRRHASALRTLDDYISGLGPEDQRMLVLNRLAEARGEMSRWEGVRFEPTPQQAVLLARIGTSGPAPQSTTTLDELVAAGVVDFIEEFRRAASAAEQAAKKAEATRSQLRAEAEKAAGLYAELSEARQELSRTSAERDELRGTVEELRGYLAAAESDETGNGDGQKPPPRRTRVDGETGVYYSDTNDGRVFEIGYRCAEGRQRWKTVGPSLKEAVELRKELTGKPFNDVDAGETGGVATDSGDAAEKEPVIA